MTHDIIVIGAGAAGLNIASFMNKAGFKVLLVERSKNKIGGDCLNFGCVPSKALIHISRMVHDAREAERFGLKMKGKVDLREAVRYVREKQDVIRQHENIEYFREHGIDIVLGNARFVAKDSIELNERIYTAKRIVIATGSKPRKLVVPGIEKVKYLTNETIFDLEILPKRLVVIGGGPIGIELGQAFQRLGAEVHVIVPGENFLPKETREMSEVLLSQLKKEGMVFHFNTKAKAFDNERELVIEDSSGQQEKLRFDEVLVSIGRFLDIDRLVLHKGSIEVIDGKIKVDPFLRTTNRRVYVCGDALGSFQFTHAAELHAGIILNNLFSPRKKRISNDNLSWVTYTCPEIATFGLNDRELRKRGIPFEKLSLEFGDDDRSIVTDYTGGRMYLFISKGKIMGGSMVAMNAGELFQELVLANSAKLDITNIFNKTYPYPTAARVNKKIIADYFAKKLTPFNKRLLRIMY